MPLNQKPMSETDEREQVKQKLAKLKEQRDAAGNYFKLQPGESAIIVIDPLHEESAIQVETEYEGKKSMRYQYVITRQDGSQQYWQANTATSNLIDDKISEEKYKVKVKRIGSGRQTIYTVESV